MLQQPLENSNRQDSIFSLEVPIVTGDEAKFMVTKAIEVDQFFQTQFPDLRLPDRTYRCPECNGDFTIEQYQGICSGSCTRKTKTLIDLLMAKHGWGHRRAVNHLAAQVGFAVCWSTSHRIKERQRELLTAALTYAQEFEWKIFPLHYPQDDGTCSCGDPKCDRDIGKHPITKNGFLDATNETFIILEQWSWKSTANIGIACGSASGFFVLDIDGEEGNRNLEKLIETHGPLPSTYRVRTGSGGEHIYFNFPAGIQITTSAGSLPPEIHVRGDGGYIVGPPSLHKTGNRYEVIERAPLADVPGWLLKLITTPKTGKFNVSGRTRLTSGHRPLVIKGLQEGERDTGLASHAGSLIGLNVPPDIAERAMIESGRACEPEFGDDESVTKLESMVKTHQRNHPDWVPPITLEEAQTRCNELVAGIKANPSMAAQERYLEGLEIVKRFDAETWLSCKAVLKKHGILREIEKELGKRLFQVVEDADTPTSTMGEVLEVLNLNVPTGCKDLIIPPGYTFRPSGILVETATEKGMRIEEVCPAFILPTKRFKDVSSKEELIEMNFEENGTWNSIISPREEISEPKFIVKALARFGVPIHGKCAAAASKYVVRFLRENVASILIQHISSTMGWIEGPTPSFLLGNTHIGGDATNAITFRSIDGTHELAESLSDEGSFDIWKHTVQSIENFPKALTILYASFCAPLLSILKIPNFIVDLSGRTSVGKTTCLRLAASVWGDPERVMKSWKSTSVGLERHVGVLNNLPFCIDDSTKAGNPDKIKDMIYLLADGVGKLRGTRGGGIAKTFKWSTVMISNGESAVTSLGNERGGKHARVVQLRGLAFDGEDNETRRLVDTININVRENFGFAGPHFVRWLIDNKNRWPEVKDRYRKKKETYVKKVSNGLAARIADSVAALSLAGELACESGALPWTEARDPFEILWPSIEQELVGVEPAVKAMRDIYEWCVSNQTSFFGRNDERIPPKWFGVWKQEGWDCIDIIPGVLKTALEAMGHDFDGAMDALAEKHWLIVEKGRRHDRRVYMNRDRVRVISITRPGINLAEAGASSVGDMLKRGLE